MRVLDLLSTNDYNFDPLPVARDPFASSDALEEAYLVGTLYSSVSRTAGLLFDLRTSDRNDPAQANTGLLILFNVSALEAEDTEPDVDRVWLVGECLASIESSSIRIEVRHLLVDKYVSVQASRSVYLIGVVSNIEPVPRDMGEGLTAFVHTSPNWDSEIELTGTATAGGTDLS